MPFWLVWFVYGLLSYFYKISRWLGRVFDVVKGDGFHSRSVCSDFTIVFSRKCIKFRVYVADLQVSCCLFRSIILLSKLMNKEELTLLILVLFARIWLVNLSPLSLPPSFVIPRLFFFFLIIILPCECFFLFLFLILCFVFCCVNLKR